MPDEKLLTFTNAAKIAKVTPQTLRRAAALGQLEATKIGPRDWAVSLKALEEWINNADLHKRGPKSKP